MPIRELIRVHDPELTVYERAFSTEFRIFGRNELQSVDRRYGHCDNATLGALYDRHGSIIGASQRDGGHHGDLVVGLDPPRVIDRRGLDHLRFQPGRTLYLGAYMNLYGHFLVETMSRFWAIGTNAFDHVAFFPFAAHRGEIVTHDFHRIFLDHFNITPDKMIILRGPVEFEEIHVPEKLCTINFCANLALPRVYRDLAWHHTTRSATNRIFLSRLEPYERIRNVTDVEDVFRELDFEIIYPETLDLHSQIERYADCRVMAGFAGSALHNCLFCQEGTALIELGDTRSSTHPLATQSVVNQASGVEAHFIAYEGSPDGRMVTSSLREKLLRTPLLARPPATRRETAFESKNHVIHYPWPASMTAHLSNIGDVRCTGNLLVEGLQHGRSAIEGLSITLDGNAPFGVEYKVLLNDKTWTAWSAADTFLGSRGSSMPIRGYAVRLTGLGARRFRCVCLGRFASQAGIVEAVDGDDCVATDHALLRGLQLQLRRRPE